MKVSMKVEYACRVLAQLARFRGNKQLSHVEELAKVEEIPANYLVQILNELKNGGLIISRRGKQGGYALAKNPDEIRLNEVVRVIDGDVIELNFSGNGQSGPRVAQVWEEIAHNLEAKMNEYTLESFLQPESETMYYI